MRLRGELSFNENSDRQIKYTLDFDKNTVQNKLKDRNNYLPSFHLLITSFGTIIQINYDFDDFEVLYWILTTVWIINTILFVNHIIKSIFNPDFVNINVITKLEIYEEHLIIDYINTLSSNEFQLSIQRNDFAIFQEKRSSEFILYKNELHLDYKIIHQEFEIYFPFIDFITEYAFKKCFDFKVPVIQKQGPTVNKIRYLINKYFLRR